MQVALLGALLKDYDEYGRPELWLCVTTLDLGLAEHRESRRRAAQQLARAGMIELCLAASEVDVSPARFHSGRASRVLLFARMPYGRSQRAHTLELRAEYEEQLGLLLDPAAEERDRIKAGRWVRWYEQPERRLTDLGDHAEPMTFDNSRSSSALKRLGDRHMG